MMTWKEIGAALGISGERARLIAIQALKKIRKRSPHLADVFAAAMRMHSAVSPAQRMIEAAPDDRADGDNWGGHRPRKDG